MFAEFVFLSTPITLSKWRINILKIDFNAKHGRSLDAFVAHIYFSI